VLSVVSIQVKSILDVLRANLEEFRFGEEMIRLKRTYGMFITMNSRYAGRTDKASREHESSVSVRVYVYSRFSDYLRNHVDGRKFQDNVCFDEEV
jgi:hypothetical protein